jgi:single-stranded-DNA-specific exonuclease
MQWQLEQAGVHPLLARLYASRGISVANELNLELADLHPPIQLTRAAEAAVLLADAIEADARLLIVADYDCDGATACALGIRALRACGATVDYVVPDRFKLGYGLSPEVVDLAAESAPDLLITVDNGIASVEGVARAQELGIATLITDHHLPGDTLPEADCIVNPNQPGCDFPSKHLAGVGVMFYVLLALRAELRGRGYFTERDIPEPNFGQWLDLVALGTVADVVTLDRNNRILVAQGLKRIRAGRAQAGVQALFTATGRSPSKAIASDLGFFIGPRLNAAGRLADMGLGIECLLTDDPVRALQIAQELEALNRSRREIEAEMQQQADVILSETKDDASGAGIALFDASWHQGVIGILASRLKDKLYRPVFAFARGDSGELKGSGRAIPGIHLRDALDIISKKSPGLIIRFGGHTAAAGLTIREDDFLRFQQMFVDVAAELLKNDSLHRNLSTDGILEASYINLPIAHLLEGEVWGQGFPAPLFECVFEVENQRVLKEKHLKLRLRTAQGSLDAIHFNHLSLPEQISSSKVRLAYRLAVNEFNGRETPQLLIEHLESLPMD